MRRTALFLIVALVAGSLLLAACGGAEPEEGPFDLEDGVYDGASDADSHGYVSAEIEIEDGSIVDASMEEFQADGTKKTPENYDYEEWQVALEELPEALVEAQSTEIDAISGATGTSEKFIQAARRALGEEEDEVGPYPDGEHVGYSDPDSHGYVSVTAIVQRGVLTHVEAQEFMADGTQKTTDNYDYEEWAVAMEELPQAAVEEQSADVDTVSGATGTSDKFRQALRRALGEEEAFEVGPYEDGIHVGESDKSDRGGWVEVEVTVLRGHIVDVAMEEYDEEGVAKTPENYDYEEWAVAAEELPEAVVEAQSADIDAVSGATGTSEMFIQAVRRALGEEEEATGYPDGEHVGYSDPDSHGYVSVTAVVENGEITDVQMEEFRADGTEKTPENYDYEEWAVAAEELPEAVVAGQTPDVDTVSGATGTSDKFRQAARRALGEEEALEVGPYEDGVYAAESDKSDRGGWVEVEVTVLLGQIVDVAMEEYDEEGVAKTPENYDYEEWAVAAEELPEAVVEAQSADIDAVSGATGTSEMFIQALERALEDAS
ncbi:MAG: FMN-binding protein [Bacillota bacterium]